MVLGPGVAVEEITEGFDGVSLVEVEVEGAIAGCLFDTGVDGEGPRAGVDDPELPFFGVGRTEDASAFAVGFAAAMTLSRLPPTSAAAVETAKAVLKKQSYSS